MSSDSMVVDGREVLVVTQVADPHTIVGDRTDLVPMNESSTHLAPDARVVERLAADMAVRGWVGPPVLCWGDLAVSGTHRIAAARRAGIACRAVDLDDLIADPVGVLTVVMQTVGWESVQAAAALFRLVLGDALADAWGCDLDIDMDRLTDELAIHIRPIAGTELLEVTVNA